MQPGDIARFTTDEPGTEREITAVSKFVDMVEIEGGWCWAAGVIFVRRPAPDNLDEQLKFLGY